MAVAAGHDPEIGAVGALVRSVELAAGSKLPQAELEDATQRIAALPLVAKVRSVLASTLPLSRSACAGIPVPPPRHLSGGWLPAYRSSVAQACALSLGHGSHRTARSPRPAACCRRQHAGGAHEFRAGLRARYLVPDAARGGDHGGGGGGLCCAAAVPGVGTLLLALRAAPDGSLRLDRRGPGRSQDGDAGGRPLGCAAQASSRCAMFCHPPACAAAPLPHTVFSLCAFRRSPPPPPRLPPPVCACSRVRSGASLSPSPSLDPLPVCCNALSADVLASKMAAFLAPDTSVASAAAAMPDAELSELIQQLQSTLAARR
jgi:hypothetical protein